MVLLRQLLGDALRHARLRQQRTLREVSAAARVSLGYLSEVERGQKEASSELLSSICDALDVRLADVLREVSDAFDLAELTRVPVERSMVSVREPVVVTTGRRGEPVACCPGRRGGCCERRAGLRTDSRVPGHLRRLTS